MDKDKFDLKMIDIEQKSFELGMLMSLFAFEILETFNNNCASVSASLNIVTPEGKTLLVESERVTLDRGTGDIKIDCENSVIIAWDDLDLSAKNIIINELHFRYKSEKLYSGFSDDGGIH